MLEIIGDSHVVALGEAFQAFESEGHALAQQPGGICFGYMGHGYEFLRPFFSCEGDNVVFDGAQMRRMFETVNPHHLPFIQPNDERRFVFVFGFYPSLCFSDEHWLSHTVAPWAGDRQFVTKSAFSAIIDHYAQFAIAFFKQLQSMNVRFSVASCCPIPASYHKLRQQSHWADCEIALIYNWYLERVAGRLEAMGIVCHLPPAEVYDEIGAMRDEFAKTPGDYHGNLVYGRLMLQKIFKEINNLP